jgi:alkylation response protein AidB-like acyl-CoA dehydrogenase
MGGFLIETLADETQKAALLPDCAEGRLLVAPMGIDDPQAPMVTCRSEGSDPGNRTYRLQGRSAFVTLADQARMLLVPTTNDTEEIIIFLVAADLPGITVTPVEKIGCRGARYCRVLLDDLALKGDDILGGAGAVDRGSEQWQRVLDISRLMTAAEALGLARGAFSYALDYARQRVQFGQAIGKFTALRSRFVEMACSIDAAALLLGKAAWHVDNDLPFHREAAVARIKAGEVASRCAMEGLQILGGYGYTMEYDIQRYVRDTIGLAAAADGDKAARDSMGTLLGL